MTGSLITGKQLKRLQTLWGIFCRQANRDAKDREARLGWVADAIELVDAPTLELLHRLLGQLGWTRERLDAFLHSSKSPVRSGVIRTMAEANRVIWSLKRMLRRAA